MAEINSIQNDNGLVSIRRGTTTSAEELPKKNADDLERFSVTVVPGKTTAQELEAQLAHLGIKFFAPKTLNNIAGINKVFDEEELTPLDDFLDKEVALWELQKSGVNVDAGVTEHLTLEKSRDLTYIGVLKELQKSGIKVDGRLIQILTPKKARDPAFIEALKELVKD